MEVIIDFFEDDSTCQSRRVASNNTVGRFGTVDAWCLLRSYHYE